MTQAEFLALIAPVHALLWHHARKLSRGRAVPADRREVVRQQVESALEHLRGRLAG